jgi:hypothetical protein
MYDLISQAVEENSSDIELLRIFESEAIISFISEKVESETVHYVKYDGVQSYVKCLGDDCLMCDTGMAKNVRHMIGVFSHETDRVAVLAITNNMKPGALLPQILNLFKKEKMEQKGHLFQQVIGIIRKGSKFIVTPMHPLPEAGLKEMNQIVDRFQHNYKEGMFGEAANLRMSADELITIPEIARIAKLKGIDTESLGFDHILNSPNSAKDFEGSNPKAEQLTLDFEK